MIIDMFLTYKKLINSKWLILSAFFLLIFSFASMADVYEDYCLNKPEVKKACSPPGDSNSCNLAEDCKKRIISEAETEMFKAIKCSEQLKEKYGIEAFGAESSKNESEGDEDSGSDSDTKIVQLKEDCNKEKQSAAECCSNPNTCNGFAKDLIQHVLPFTPALYSAYTSYKVSDKAGKGELTHEQARDKMCHSSNQVSLGVFGTSLLSQLMPMFQKTCGKRISACKSACNNHVDRFKQEFRNCYAGLFPGQNISSMIKKAKSCFELESSLDDESFDKTVPVELKGQSHNFSNIIASGVNNNKPNNKCYFVSKTSSSMKGGFNKADPVNQEGIQTVALSELLYIAKAYKKTTEKYHLSEKSNEKEVIDCGNQPDRVLDSSYKPGGPVPAPAIQLCKSAVDYAVNKTPPPMPKTASAQTNNIGQAGSFAGNTKSSNMTPLNVPAGDECQYGVLDSESLEDCPISPAGDDLPDSPNKPALAKNLPSWGGKGGPNSSGGGGGGGIGSGGAGSLAGDSVGDRDGSMYPPYSDDMSASAGFPGGYKSDSYGDGGGGSSSAPYRELAEDLDDDSMPDMGMPFDEEEDLNREKSIFQLASERIQNFCSDYSCDE